MVRSELGPFVVAHIDGLGLSWRQIKSNRWNITGWHCSSSSSPRCRIRIASVSLRFEAKLLRRWKVWALLRRIWSIRIRWWRVTGTGAFPSSRIRWLTLLICNQIIQFYLYIQIDSSILILNPTGRQEDEVIFVFVPYPLLTDSLCRFSI